MSDFEQRFGGVARLFGPDGLARLRAAHVCVIGIGGVGSWTVEALARSGVGALTLVDLDEVCVTNVNRQIHALDQTVGQGKASVMAERVRAIQPDCRVDSIPEFFNEANADAILSQPFDFVVDAIDALSNKCRLLAGCRARELRVVSCGAAGGRTDATLIRVADLAAVTHDRLFFQVRRRLRHEHAFPRAGEKCGIDCVYSCEATRTPEPSAASCGISGTAASAEPLRLNCESGHGSAAFVTGTFGLIAAGVVVRHLASAPKP